MPFTLNAVGAGLPPLNEPMKPSVTEPPVETGPFQLALEAVTCAPDCVQVPFQPWLTA
jgi:hypothetical protein